MSQKQADLILVIDASQSMGPCFAKLKDKLGDLLAPLWQADFDARIGILGYASGRNGSTPVHDLTFVGGTGTPMVRELYSAQPEPQHFFTRETSVAGKVISGLTARGNEDTLLALDIALDFPFRPLSDCRRLIAVFTDEKLEDSVSGREPCKKIADIMAKVDSRHVSLFIMAPASPALEKMCVEALTSAVTAHPIDKGGDGLNGVNFGDILGMLGKTLTVGSLQSEGEAPWKRAIFGQDQWNDSRFASASSRSVVLAVGESSALDTSIPLTRLNIKLQWTAAVDLDLHAFYITHSDCQGSVYYADDEAEGLVLDIDAGVGNVGGSNEENITLTSLSTYSKILFATKIYSKGGSFSDYDGKILVQTSNGQDITVPLSARERADWCVIALLDNSNPANPKVVNLNRVQAMEPDVGSF